MIGAAVILPLQLGLPALPSWLRSIVPGISAIVLIICAAAILLYNKRTYGVYLPGPPKG
ncbi:MAG: hypothetical protein ACTHJ3_01840 [Pararhizobium sp.]